MGEYGCPEHGTDHLTRVRDGWGGAEIVCLRCENPDDDRFDGV